MQETIRFMIFLQVKNFRYHHREENITAALLMYKYTSVRRLFIKKAGN